MNAIQALCTAYERHIQLAWSDGLSGAEKVLLCRYDPRDERRLRARLGEFEMATHRAGHDWRLEDITFAFEEWLATHEYRNSYFAAPDLLDHAALQEFLDELAARLKRAVARDASQVVALLGAGTLFGLAHVSEIIEAIAPSILGRLLVFFPGERDRSNYRLLSARDGWNYLATPIEVEELRP